MLKTNADKVVEFILQCYPGQPRVRDHWSVDHQGKPFLLPAIGGISINVKAGDSAFGWAGDHVEPGVSCTADTSKPNDHPNNSLQIFACAGNKAEVATGDAKGSLGYVLGSHGGSEHVMVEFPRETKEKLLYSDTIKIYGRGQGLQLMDYPEIALFSLDPDLLQKMQIKEIGNSKLAVPVTTIVPAVCMGSGIGGAHAAKGDYDIMTSEPDAVKEYELDKICFGDIVAIMDHDNRFGRAYKKGAVTIGIVVHSDCLRAGHGPGVATLMTCESPLIEPVIYKKANIVEFMKK